MTYYIEHYIVALLYYMTKIETKTGVIQGEAYSLNIAQHNHRHTYQYIIIIYYI